MRDVPAPETRAPILFRQSATSRISGSRAALVITVVPLAKVAAISATLGAAHGDLGKVDGRALEAARRLRDHIAAVDGQFGAELLQRHDQEIDRPGADGATAGQREPWPLPPRPPSRALPPTQKRPPDHPT